jgi:hypothetical protein
MRYVLASASHAFQNQARKGAGSAARLPNEPGSQRLIPPWSAADGRGFNAAAIEARKTADTSLRAGRMLSLRFTAAFGT